MAMIKRKKKMTKFDLRQKMKMMMENLIMENDDKEESMVNFLLA